MLILKNFYLGIPADRESSRSPIGVETVAALSVRETSVTPSFSSPGANRICRLPTDRIALRPDSEEATPTSRISVSFCGGDDTCRVPFGSGLCVGTVFAALACSRVGCSGRNGETSRPSFIGCSRTTCRFSSFLSMISAAAGDDSTTTSFAAAPCVG